MSKRDAFTPVTNKGPLVTAVIDTKLLDCK